MFTTDQREHLRTLLLDKARADTRLSGAAITGSASHGTEDRWSDVDLFFGVAAGTALQTVLDDWTDFMYAAHGALHHFDITSGPAIYRVFLLPDCLEVDLAFTPANEFGARGPNFRTIFGQTNQVPQMKKADPSHLIGLAWHHVLHARTSIERRKVWQAEYWISAIRDYTLALTSLRFGKPSDYSKGADDLPREIMAPLEDALVRSLSFEELRRALGAAVEGLLRELSETNGQLADRLASPLRQLASFR
ncbi:MAG: nucleotidyltransferase domain-containing protein [Candidatus Eremiobacteraeota bacterium]|nr:nucleotidyltransferase domain-containing protein [Candidatus Eremiobacteraeota bacterium]MBC5827384.1 nucleotidyltransferase domain-containing protein [Candidatus Eremiobacteraeota bacterium]